jgi:hypothetical protein
MTIEEMHRWFDLVVDKVGSPYFESDEKDTFLTRAEVSLVNSFFKRGKEPYQAEFSDKDVERISFLIRNEQHSTDDLGRFASSNLNTNTSLLYYLNIGVSDNPKCGPQEYKKSRFVRHNDFFAHSANAFKKPEAGHYVHRFVAEYIQFDPQGQLRLDLTYVERPTPVTLDDQGDGLRGPNAVDSDLDEKLHNKIVLQALGLAGISIREAEFTQFIMAEEQQQA